MVVVVIVVIIVIVVVAGAVFIVVLEEEKKTIKHLLSSISAATVCTFKYFKDIVQYSASPVLL